MGLLNNELLIFEFEDAVEAKCVGRGSSNVLGRKTELGKMEPRFWVCEKKKSVG